MSLFNSKYKEEADKARARLELLIKKGAVINLTEKHPQRSLAQNNLLHLQLSYFASQYGCSEEEAKVDFFKRKWNPDIFIRVGVNKKGREITYLRSSAELSTDEMTTAINRFRYMSLTEADIYLPSPEDRDFIVHCQQEIENNKEFISYNDEQS